MRCFSALFMALALLATPADADETSVTCTLLPGDAADACTVSENHLQVETAAVRWLFDGRRGSNREEVLIGSTVLRYGVSERLEIDVGWVPFNVVTTTDRRTGLRQRVSGVGDVSLGLRRSLSPVGGDGVAVAVQGFVVAPTAASGTGLGFWLMGGQLALSFNLSNGLDVGATPGIERVPNAFRPGHHLGYTGAIRIGHNLGGANLRGGFNVLHDADPDAPFTQASARFVLGWQSRLLPGMEFDAGANYGLTAATPDIEMFFYIIKRF